ncbi:MAG TPA: flavodoxin domain-containing protein [Candidatus Limnocylindrales bacterium]
MTRVLVVHASRHGSTGGIAVRIGETLRAEGIEAIIAPAADEPSSTGFDAYVVGSGVYMGSWLKEGIQYLEREAATLATRPTWLFSSGPLRGSTRESADPNADPIENALGPAEGPGSGGRRRIEALSTVIRPRDHHVFMGAFDPTDRPRAISERLVRMMPASKNILPPGDFRQWDLIDAWARGIAGALRRAAA